MSMVRPQGELRQRRQPHRDEAYRRYVASLPCLACGYHDSQAAHVSAGNFARGMKAPDYLCIPLCPDRVGQQGCHSQFDQGQEAFSLANFGVPVEWLKVKAERDWLRWEREQ